MVTYNCSIPKDSLLIKYIQILLKDTFNPDLRVTEQFDKQTSDCIYDYLVDRFDTPVYAMDVSLEDNLTQVGVGNQKVSYPNFSNILQVDETFCMLYVPDTDVQGQYLYQTVYYCDSINCPQDSPTYPWVHYTEAVGIDQELVNKLCVRNFNTNGFVLPKYYKEMVDMTPVVTTITITDTIINVRKKPDTKSTTPIIATLDYLYGEVLDNTTNEYGTWYKVKYHNGKEYITGYVQDVPNHTSFEDSDPTEVLNYVLPVSSIYKREYLDQTSLEYVTSYNLTEFVISFIIGRVITPMSTPEEIAYVRKLLADGVENGYVWDNELLAQLVNRQISLSQYVPNFVPTGYFDLKTESYILSVVEPEVG